MKLFLSLLILLNTAYAVNPGDDAIDFKLTDQHKKEVLLSSYKGKFIILEWFNYGCPYVKKFYDSKAMQATQGLYQDNDLVKWVTITSSAEGKQGFLKGYEEVTEVVKKWGIKSDHFLRDTTGNIGRAYGAKTTPHIFIIDPEFKIRYAGAIDSIASSDATDIGKATNYITASLSKLLLKQEPNPAKTRPYGCSVKY